MRQLRDNSGATALVGFMIAIVLFSVSFYYVIEQSVQREGNTTVAENANFDSRASSVASILLDEGDGWYAAPGPCVAVAPWINHAAFDPDGVGASGRFGLGDEQCQFQSSDSRNRNNLSFEKMRNLLSAKMAADPTNDKVDYEEAKASLQLEDAEMDFHIRSWPVLASVQQILGTGQQDPFMRPLYIGTFRATLDVDSKEITPTLTDLGDRIRISATIGHGLAAPATDAQFMFTVSINWKFSRSVILHTPILSPGDPDVPVELTILKSGDWTWKKSGPTDEPWIDWKLTDLQGVLDSGRFDLGPSGLNIDMKTGPNVPNVFVHADTDYVDVSTTGANFPIKYNAWKGDGSAYTMADADWDLRITRPSPPVTTYDLGASSGGSQNVAITTGSVGVHLVELWNEAGTTLYNWDRAVAHDDAIHEYGWEGDNYAPSDATAAETRYIEYLIQHFERNVYNMEGLPPPHDPEQYDSVVIPWDETGIGDVFPGEGGLKEWLPNVLTDGAGNCNLDKYTTVIVGSDVDQEALVPAEVKFTLECWVEAGGTMLVFGSNGQTNNWLVPVYETSLSGGAGTGLSAPDEDHPILNVPNQLDYQAYTGSSQWDDADEFTPVVETQEGDETPNLLMINEPGSLGSGTVVLSGWRPSALTPDQAANCAEPLTVGTKCEGLMLMHNLITVTYRSLFLDYGPPLPTSSSSGVHSRITSVYHPELEQLLTVQLQVFVFED